MKSKVSAMRRGKLSADLKRVFHFEAFHESQKEIIQSVLKGQDTLAILPTGAGKSLCYQLPAIELKGLTVVVTPLISLMKDQQEKLRSLKIESAAFNSAQSRKLKEASQKLLKKSEAKVIFVTPERLASAKFRADLKGHQISLLVIDEAHCISEWGHDFRPAYTQLAEARRKLKNPPVLALTATATELVEKEIVRELRLKDAKVFRSSIARENLFFAAKYLEKSVEREAELLKMMESAKRGATIIYTSSIKVAKEIHALLTSKNVETYLYHGKLSRDKRHSAQEKFMKKSSAVMVATNAFGMGIDKANVRSVVHFQMPGSLDSYYQEAGRAGRDGKRSVCTLLYLKKDRSIHNFFLGSKYPSKDQIVAVYKLLKMKSAPISKAELREQASISKRKVDCILGLFLEASVISESKDGLRLTAKVLDEKQIEELASSYHERIEADHERLKQVTIYAETALCRWHHLRRYFGESTAENRCGSCDNCRKFKEGELA